MNGTLPDADVRLALAVEQFNRGDYYDCHNTLEALWRDERDPLRDLYKGILQIAVGLYHESRGNRRGATRLLDTGAALCAPFAPAALGLDLATLLDAVRACRARLTNDPSPLTPICAPRLTRIP